MFKDAITSCGVTLGLAALTFGGLALYQDHVASQWEVAPTPKPAVDPGPSIEARYAWFVKKEKARKQAEVSEDLFDPFTAVFEWRKDDDGYLWLHINAKNRFGGYVGFQPTLRSIPSFSDWRTYNH